MNCTQRVMRRRSGNAVSWDGEVLPARRWIVSHGPILDLPHYVVASDLGERHDPRGLLAVGHSDLAHDCRLVDDQAVHIEAPAPVEVGYRACTAAKSARPRILSPEHGQSIAHSGARRRAAPSQSLARITAQKAVTTSRHDIADSEDTAGQPIADTPNAPTAILIRARPKSLRAANGALALLSAQADSLAPASRPTRPLAKLTPGSPPITLVRRVSTTARSGQSSSAMTASNRSAGFS